jgi:hypothetical protein
MDQKFRPVHYKPPIKSDMAIVLVFFNPQRSVRIVQNILTVVHYLKTANIPYYIHELAFNDEPHVFAPAENIKLSRSTSYMFYKENLIHTLLPQIPAKFTKICIMDADIFFDEPLWYTVVSTMLDIYDVCQPFTTTYFLGPDYKAIKQLTNCVDSSAPKIDWVHEHTGHVWAFRRSWYEESGIPDVTIAGGGDFVMSTTLRGSHHIYDKTYLLYKDFLPTKSFADTRRGSCDLNIYHYYHGSEINRQYYSRIESITDVLATNGLTLQSAFQRRKDGILEWKSAHLTVMNDFMRGYFGRRNDDLVKSDFFSTNKLFTPLPYAYPVIQDMVVVIPFFNPVQYNRISQNLITVKHWMDQARIPYYIGEIAHGSAPFLFKPDHNILQFRSDSILFHKENLIDIIEKSLPAVYKKICILDADILFDTPTWYKQTSQVLDSVQICQPFKTAVWTHPDFTEFRRRTNCLSTDAKEIDWPTEHPGFAWAFQRSWYRDFPYRHIRFCTIGGDTILHDLIKHRRSQYQFYPQEYDAAEALNLTTTYGTLDFTINHLNHGSYIKRCYNGPNEYMKRFMQKLVECGFKNPSDAVISREDGLLEWRPECKSILNEYNNTYFLERCEDDTD